MYHRIAVEAKMQSKFVFGTSLANKLCRRRSFDCYSFSSSLRSCFKLKINVLMLRLNVKTQNITSMVYAKDQNYWILHDR